MTTKQFLPLPYGKDVYSELKDNGCYFVDKTPYLKELIDKDKSNVMLFTRPRRFGKTLFMSMVEYFFFFFLQILETPYFSKSCLKIR